MKYFFWSVFLGFVQFCFGQTELYFPEAGVEWVESSPAKLGFDEKKLAIAVDSAMANEYSGAKDLRQAILKGFEYEPYHKILGPTKKRGGPAGMVIKNGFVVAQWGDTKRVDMTFSVTKSYLSTIAGLAVDAGKIRNTKDKLSEYVWDGKFDSRHNSKISWAHLLHQSSDWSGQLWGGLDWADRPPREGDLDDWKFRQLHEPGSIMEYNDVRVNLLAYSLLQVWRKPLPQVLKEKIMDPIGASTTWRWFGYDNSWTNVDGMQMQSVSGGGHSGGGLFISTEDHARFGLLFLNEGVWDGDRLISESWIKEATTPSPANKDYGYLWWLNPDDDSRMNALSPEGYYAAGFGGNYIIIEPKHNLVIVFRWLQPSQANRILGLFMDAVK